jgi:DNA-binding MarR family transcriptional regulator
LQRFDARVMELMADHPGVPLGLANLAARGQVGAAHIHITRHLGEQGLRLTDLAQRAGMSKQAWGMVTRERDPMDARARKVQFTASGMAWLSAYQDAAAQAQAEMHAAVGPEVAAVIAIGLEIYSGQ